MLKLLYILEIFSISLSLILPLMITIAFFTLIERKIMGSLQRRIGPNMHGYYGVLQPLIDGLKLLWKEMLVPAKANFFIFIFSPMFMMSLSFSLWAVLPLSFTFSILDSKLSLIVFFIISSLNVYNIVLAGWSSNSKYAFLGAIRTIAQMLSYELVLGFVLIFMLFTVGSLRIYDIIIKQYYVGYLFWPLLPFAIIFFIVLLMETNRAPFDLPEAESELVAGYNVEYSSIMFAMFFLGEYCNILAMSGVWTILFWGGFVATYFGVSIFILKILFISFIFIFIRSMLPRYRIDQLIYVGWHVLLPVTLGIFFIFLIFSYLLSFLSNTSTVFNTWQTPTHQQYALSADAYGFTSAKLESSRFNLTELSKLVDYSFFLDLKEEFGFSQAKILLASPAEFTNYMYTYVCNAAINFDNPSKANWYLDRQEELRIGRFTVDVKRAFYHWLLISPNDCLVGRPITPLLIEKFFDNWARTTADIAESNRLFERPTIFFDRLPIAPEYAYEWFMADRVRLPAAFRLYPEMIHKDHFALTRDNAAFAEKLLASIDRETPPDSGFPTLRDYYKLIKPKLNSFPSGISPKNN